jgi:hypothetical protein
MEGPEGGNRVSVVRRRVAAALVLLALAGAALFVLVAALPVPQPRSTTRSSGRISARSISSRAAGSNSAATSS